MAARFALILCVLFFSAATVHAQDLSVFVDILGYLDVVCQVVQMIVELVQTIMEDFQLRKRRSIDGDENWNGMLMNGADKDEVFMNDPECGVISDIKEKVEAIFKDEREGEIREMFPRFIHEMMGAIAFPWVVSIGFGNTETGAMDTVLCSGTLIKGRWVLTTAHCLHNLTFDDGQRLVMVAGERNVSISKGYFIKVRSVFLHDDFDIETLENDIALVELNSDATLLDGGRSVRPACIPNENTVLEQSSNCWSLSHGRLGMEDDPMSVTVQHLNMETFAGESCYRPGMNVTNENQFCGVNSNKWTNCEVKPGDAYTCSHEGRLNVVGVTSSGTQCGEQVTPAIYTRINKYVSWMNEKVRN